VTPSLNEDFRGSRPDFEVLREGGRNTSKTPENPSNSANGNDVTVDFGNLSTLARENSGTGQFFSTSPAQRRPNGLDDAAPSLAANPLSEVEEQILQVWREHPDWSFRKIGRECAVTHRRAQRVIAPGDCRGGLAMSDPSVTIDAPAPQTALRHVLREA